MSDVVIVLGAGASVEAGAPLMWNFLDVAEDLLGGAFVGDDVDAFRRVFSGIAALQGVAAKGKLDLVNLEQVFAAFEMARLLGRLGSFTEAEIEELRTSMRRLIERTLEVKIRFPIRADGSYVEPAPYGRFVQGLQRLSGDEYNRDYGRISIITFNYDLCLDFSLQANEIGVDYALGGSPRPRGVVRLLKLHGSLNWVRCAECRAVEPVPVAFRNLASPSLTRRRQQSGVIGISGRVRTHVPTCHTDQPPPGEPMLVPPTFSKEQYHEALSSVWRAAADELSTARYVFVSGFSLPPTDSFFRYLYGLGTLRPETRVRGFRVYDPSRQVAERFWELLGDEVRSRFVAADAKFAELAEDLVAYGLDEPPPARRRHSI